MVTPDFFDEPVRKKVTHVQLTYWLEEGLSSATTPKYKHTPLKSFLAKAAIPVFGILHRPSLQWLAEAMYDLALRWNGFAIGFAGKQGLSEPEEGFLRNTLPGVKGGVLFDVGANHGSYALLLKKTRPDLRVIAFEPHPKSFAILQSRTASAGIHLENLALSDVSGIVQLHDFASEDGSTQASLSKNAVQLFDADTVSHDVHCTTLDEYAERHGIERIGLLKIDTEGFDINVLRGSERLIRERRIDMIQFEFIPTNIVTKVSIRDFRDVLPNFRLFRLGVHGHLIPMQRYSVKRHEVYVIHNIIALPEPATERAR